MGTAITTTIDAAGRLVIPKSIRDRAELEPGIPLRIDVVDGRIEIVPEARSVRIVTKGRLRVAVPAAPSEALTASHVRRTLESIRRERGRREP
jgi:AbrB family looped-hinge helix DNA binding protein